MVGGKAAPLGWLIATLNVNLCLPAPIVFSSVFEEIRVLGLNPAV